MTIPGSSLEQPYNNGENNKKKAPPIIKGMSSLQIVAKTNKFIYRESYFTRLLKKMKENPPNMEIADKFFSMCIAVACLSKYEYVLYEERVLSKSPAFETLTSYISDNFRHEEKGVVVYGELIQIGHLLMCGGIPNSYSQIAKNYRSRLCGKSVYDPKIDKSKLSEWLRRTVNFCTRRCKTEHARVCGFITCQFMIYCIKGKPFPNLDFLNSETTTLTDEQKGRLLASRE